MGNNETVTLDDTRIRSYALRIDIVFDSLNEITPMQTLEAAFCVIFQGWLWVLVGISLTLKRKEPIIPDLPLKIMRNTKIWKTKVHFTTIKGPILAI